MQVLYSRGLHPQAAGRLVILNNILGRLYLLGGLHSQAAENLINLKNILGTVYKVGGFMFKEQED